MSYFQRNLARHGKPVVIEDRDLKLINGQSREVFSNPRDDIGLIKTLEGVSVFDNTNTERVATHRICLDYRDDVGAEQWLKLNGTNKRVKILTAENKCENNEVLILMCTERGEDSKIVNSG